MEHLIWVLLISIYVCAYSSAYEPVNWVLDRHRSTHPARLPAYSRDFLDEYEPYAYAAIPIHSPMPLLHVISPSNSKPRPKKYTRPIPQQEQYVYSSDEQSQEYSQEEYSDSIPRPKYSSYYEDDAPVLVYARPNKKGGYTYRRPSASTSLKGSLVQPSHEPFVIRIHKYRLVKD